jgi:hypothetical protein
MGYRDDKQAMRQRIEQLEGELESAHQTIARLKGHIHERASDDAADLLGKQTVHLRRELEVVLDDQGMEAIATMLRTRLPQGQVSMVGRTLHCKLPTGALQVMRHERFTEVVVDDNHPQPRWAKALGGLGFAVLGGPLLAAPFAALGVPEAALIAYVPLVLVAGYLLMDQLLRRTFHATRQQLAGALEATVELAREHGKELEPLRFDTTAEAAAEAQAELEAQEAEARDAEATLEATR